MTKKSISKLAALVLLLTFSGCVSTGPNKDLALKRYELDTSESWRYQIPNLSNPPQAPKFPDVKRAQLKNGLQIYVVEDNRLPIAEARLMFKNGSASDIKSKAGLMSFTTSMLKEGTKKLSSLELAEAFANLGTEVSVGAGKDLAQLSAGVISSKIADVIALLADMAQYPRMDANDFARVKIQTESGLAAKEGMHAYVAQTTFLKAVYGDEHPYSHPSIGTLATVRNITVKDLQNAHAGFFGPDNAALVVVGDVSLKQIKKLAKTHFGSWRKKAFKPQKIADPKLLKNMITKLVDRKNSPQTYLLIGQSALSQTDNSLAALEVFTRILAGSPTSRLDANLREAKGWTYGVSSGVSPLLGKGPLMVSTSIRLPYGSEALGEILNEFDKLKNSDVSDQELDMAKNVMLHSFATRYSTIGRVAGILGEQFVYQLPDNNDELFYQQISRVNKKDIRAVANKILKKDQTVAVAVGELDAMQIPLAKMNVGTVSIEREEGAGAR